MINKSHIIRIILLILVFNLSAAFAQEEDQAKKKPTTKKKTSQVRKADERFYRFKTDTRIGFKDNVFNTPSGQYVDPETSVLRTSAPTEGYFLNPDLELSLTPFNNNRSEIEVAYSWEGTFFSGGDNVKNADGYHQRLEAGLDFDFISKKLQNDNSVIRKSSVDLKIYHQQVEYNYLHRGTGALRNTKIAQIDEENRYQYAKTGATVDFKTRFTSDTKLGLSVETSERDYEDIATLPSYDRKDFETKIEVEQELGLGWNIFADYSKVELKYDRYRATSANGNSVNGTTRNFNDTEIMGGVEYDRNSIQSMIKYSILKRDDIFAEYWSYDQNTVSILISKEWLSFGRLKIEGTQEDRDYKLEKNSFGMIRSRKSNELELGWDRDFNWGTISAKVSELTQDDTDSYYSYKNRTVHLGFEKDF